MAAEGWWLPDVRGELSQGDILGPVNFYSPLWPLKHLRYTDLRGKGAGWAESDAPVKSKTGLVHLLGHAKTGPGIVISHDCEIDKPNKNSRVQIAHVIELKTIAEELAAKIRQQKSFRYMPLPSMPHFGDCAVDFRTITAFPSDISHETTRVASLSDEARLRLQAALWAFFTRREEIGAAKSDAQKPA